MPAGLLAWLVFIAAILAVLGWAMLTGRITWSMAVDVRQAAAGFVVTYPMIAYAGYILVFTLISLALLPVQSWILIFAGMLFGFWPSMIVCWIGCILGAVVVFIAASGVLAGNYRKAVDRYLGRIEAVFRGDQLSWMLTLRLIPIVPYCVANVAPPILGARFAPFLVATMIGVIPFIVAYSWAGERAAGLLETDAPPDIARIAWDMGPVLLVVAAIPVAALLARRLLRRRAKPAAQAPRQPPTP